jgi:hypothetical protein
MGSSDIESSEIGAEFVRVLGNWVKLRKLVLTGEDNLTIPELFTGWKISISQISPPVFE